MYVPGPVMGTKEAEPCNSIPDLMVLIVQWQRQTYKQGTIQME